MIDYVLIFIGVMFGVQGAASTLRKFADVFAKQIFADTVASAVPVAGGVISGGITYAAFKPGCMKLRKNLMSYNLCDPDYYRENIKKAFANENLLQRLSLYTKVL